MTPFRHSSRLLPVLLLSAALCLLAGPAARARNYQYPAYQAAVADARVAEYSEISRSLTAINPYNQSLAWEGAPGESRVLMVSWVSGDYYDSSLGGDYTLPSWLDLWVTAAPDLKVYFAGQGAPNKLRLEQALGLPPGDNKTKLVEFWVNPADMFRPSPDPEISDSEAELDFPSGQVSVSPEYRSWFNDLMATQYNQPAPYPWTRLGYTYDWGREDHVGLSEFVVRGGSTMGVRSVTPTLQYFD